MIETGGVLPKLQMFEPEFEQVRVIDEVEAGLVIQIVSGVLIRDAHPVLARQGLFMPGGFEGLALQLRVGHGKESPAALFGQQGRGLAHDRGPVFKPEGVQGVRLGRHGNFRADPLQTLFEFPRGLAGEGQDKNPGRIGPFLQQMAHPAHEGLGLARAGTGQHQHRAGTGQNRRELHLVRCLQGVIHLCRRFAHGAAPTLAQSF